MPASRRSRDTRWRQPNRQQPTLQLLKVEGGMIVKPLVSRFLY
jgi:hypothetical protein